MLYIERESLDKTSHSPQLDELVELFYADPAELAQMYRCAELQCPEIYRKLLAHNSHMTVAVEQHHREQVDVEVLRDKITAIHYQREILLRKKSDRQVVQYGIVRLRLSTVSDEVRAAILSKQIPLGRVLIDHDVLRQVQLSALWRIECGESLARCFDVHPGTITYGRTAMIYLDGEPAIELLEIVAPESQ